MKRHEEIKGPATRPEEAERAIEATGKYVAALNSKYNRMVGVLKIEPDEFEILLSHAYAGHFDWALEQVARSNATEFSNE